MERTRNSFFVAIVLLLPLVVCGFAGITAADHGSPANFTVSPQDVDDRAPGITDGTYAMRSAGADAFDSERGLEFVDYYWIESEQADFTACNPDNARVFGIDRGNNNSGTQTDVDLLEHMKNYEIDGNRIALELYDEEDFGGESINLNAPDATVAVLGNCVENTGDAGWYQFQGYVNGTTYDGGYEEVYLDSHYFWIGDFDSETEAREALGPPPSEQGSGTDSDGGSVESTPTPTSSASTPTQDTPAGGDDGATDGDTDGGDEPTSSTPTPEASGDANGGDGGSVAAENADGGEATPTLGDGSGFGSLLAVFAVLSAALLVGRR